MLSVMIATVLSAVLPAHANQNFSESALPEITHAKKENQ
jgi:hypothetical protein